MAGIRTTVKNPPVDSDNDENGYVLAWRTDPHMGRTALNPGWVRVPHDKVARDPKTYPWWIPLADFHLLPIHED